VESSLEVAATADRRSKSHPRRELFGCRRHILVRGQLTK
jgi:hypothetical protein